MKRSSKSFFNSLSLKSFKTKKSMKPKNYLWIVFFTKKFVEKLKWKAFYSKLTKLEPYHYSIINDNSTIASNSYQYYKSIEKKKKDFFHDRFVINLIYLSILKISSVSHNITNFDIPDST